MLLLDNPDYRNGLGLEIHIRTKINTWWSFIESAVIRIGEDTLEIKGGDENQFWVNGEEGGFGMVRDGEHENFSGYFAGDHHIKFKWISKRQRRFRIDLGAGDAISVETFKEMVSVNVHAVSEAKFRSSRGLLGSYPEGHMLARNGTTVLNHADEFGLEWQVGPTERQLFRALPGPGKCEMPTTSVKRRLSESHVEREAAEIACAHAKPEEKDHCIFDVLAMSDLEVAYAY